MSRNVRAVIGVCLLVLVAGLSLAPAQSALAAGQPIRNQYIVVLDPPARGTLAARQSVDEQAQVLLAQVGGGEVLQRFDYVLRGFSAHLSATQARLISKLAGVDYVEQDQVMSATATQTETGATWGLDRSDQHDLPLDARYIYPQQAGEGVDIYIIDTGLHASHQEFTGRVGVGRNFVGNGGGGLLCSLLGIGCSPDATATDDCNGHGTHVTGTAAGTVYGIAKRATVHPVRVLDCNGSGTTSTVIAGVDWVAANATLPAVANMSLGGGDSAALDQAVDNAIASGVSFVVAAGNDSADACTGSPNKVPAAITVGATTQQDRRASYSNYGSCVDLFAPGSGVTSAWYTGDAATKTISGTSMATPHVTGAVALLLGADAGMTPAQVAAAIVDDATPDVLGGVGSGSPNALLFVTH